MKSGPWGSAKSCRLKIGASLSPEHEACTKQLLLELHRHEQGTRSSARSKPHDAARFRILCWELNLHELQFGQWVACRRTLMATGMHAQPENRILGLDRAIFRRIGVPVLGSVSSPECVN